MTELQMVFWLCLIGAFFSGMIVGHGFGKRARITDPPSSELRRGRREGEEVSNDWEFIGADGHKCPRTMDARPWAQEYCKRFPEADRDAMLGWFANSIMAGFDAAMRRSEKELEELQAFKAGALKLTTAASVEHVK